MHLYEFKNVINACRFCFMCRHLDPVGNVTYCESDTPRGRALVADKISMHGESLENPDYVRMFYKTALSASCRHHCVSSYDEASLAKAVRMDIVENGVEPDRVKSLAQVIKTKGNPFGADGDSLNISGSSRKAETLYYIDSHTLYKQPEIARAFTGILKRAGVNFSILKETRSSGKNLSVLGYKKDAAAAARKTASAIKASGCRTIVTSCPAAFDAFKNDYPSFGIALKGIRALHSSEYILELFENGLLKPSGRRKTRACYLDSDYLKNYNGITKSPRKLLQYAGFNIIEFGSNQEESYSLGEGAVVFDLLNPDILEKMRRGIIEKMKAAGTGIFVTASPYTKYAFGKEGVAKKNKVISLEEAVVPAIR